MSQQPVDRTPRLVDPRPVGVFDSGVGGLSVLREIVNLLPHERVWYVADSRHAPYGERPEAFIDRRAHAIAGFLRTQDVKAIVVACNTATGVAIAGLRAAVPLPIVGIEPAVKPAAGQTRSGTVGVLATSRTLASAKFQRLLAQHGAGATIVTQACPGLVERIEAGDLTGEATRALVASYLEPLLARGADTIVLGCTHYAAVIPLIRELAGRDVTVMDPARPVARELARRLDGEGLRAEGEGAQRFWTSGDVMRVRPVIARLWGGDVDVEALPAAFCEDDQPELAG